MAAAWTGRRMASPTELEELAPHVVYELRAMLAARHLHQVAFAGTFSRGVLNPREMPARVLEHRSAGPKASDDRYACHYVHLVTEWAAARPPAQPPVFETHSTSRVP